MTGPAYTLEGAPEPLPLPTAVTSDAEPRGSAGIGNQGTTGTADQVGAIYGDITSASVHVAMAKREADQAVLSK